MIPDASSKCVEAIRLARDALSEHYRAADRLHGGEFNDGGVEALKRLDQLMWLLEEVGRRADRESELNCVLQAIGKRVEGDEFDADGWRRAVSAPEVHKNAVETLAAMGEMETLAEAFYWIAARTVSVIRRLPGMRGFDARCVTDIRNNLLEHPEGKNSGVVWGGFASGGPQGPVLKAIRYSDQIGVWPDLGLFTNALSFGTNLRICAVNALNGHPPPVSLKPPVKG